MKYAGTLGFACGGIILSGQNLPLGLYLRDVIFHMLCRDFVPVRVGHVTDDTLSFLGKSTNFAEAMSKTLI